MLKIAVCDDEKEFCDLLKEMLCKVMKSLGGQFSLKCYTDTDEFRKTMPDFDIIFMDIRMAGINGMELAKMLRADGYDKALIFITAFQEYVFDAFELEATDYLCKPVREQKLRRAVERAIEKVRGAEEKSLFIQTLHWCKSVKLKTILYCEVMNRKIYLHTTNEVIDYYGKIEELEGQLDHRFFRCHRSYLVNFDYVMTYAEGQVVLESRECIPVSRLRQKEFMGAMLQYLKRTDRP